MTETEGERVTSRPDVQRFDPHRAATLEAFSDVSYRDDFWPDRRYEDNCDRIALRAMLPPSGERLMEVGAGFGRLANEYAGFREVALVDISEPLLEAARQRLAADPRFRIVAGDAYGLPFADATFDAVVCVRVIHHFEDPRPAIAEFARVLRPGGVLVLESRNKRDIKAVVAFALRRQGWSPFARGSRRYAGVRLLPGRLRSRVTGPASGEDYTAQPAGAWSAPTSFVHAPVDLRAWLRQAGLPVAATRSVGLLRVPVVTRHMPIGLLVLLERVLQVALAPVTAGPSLFLRAVRLDPGEPR